MGAPPPEPKGKPIAVLTITMYPGGVEVEGPIDQKMLCYGMLGEAKDQIKKFNDDRKASSSIFIPPTGR